MKHYKVKDILLITPPFTQLNTPYPATAYLKGFLNTKEISSFQLDLGIEVIQKIFCYDGLSHIFKLAENQFLNNNSQRILALKTEYLSTIDEVILFLQGHKPSLARKICSELYLPQASRFSQTDYMEWAFGFMGIQDKAKHLATLYFEDLCDFISDNIDANFGVSRYAESLGMSANSFDNLYDYLQTDLSYIEQIAIDILGPIIAKNKPKLVCFSVPFPGNLAGAFRAAQYIKQRLPDMPIAMGGGFANTELRSLSDSRVFQFFDFICLDDGERPIKLIYEAVNKKTSSKDLLLKRTWVVENGKPFFNNLSLQKDYKQADLGTPDYSDLRLQHYISVIEQANPMHTLWSDGVWLKLTMAHGCYWGKCTFCDVSLPYIGDYEPNTAKLLVDRMEVMMEETGLSGFHFVDEAAPPALMRELALEIIRRKLNLTWWTNIRFEKSFTFDLCRLLQASGCIAVSGGLEVASNRLLKLIDKGVTVEQVAQVTKNFTENGMLVHAYLMYGYPTQTEQETIDSLEMVRQLFELGILQSGFWHQFSLTAHSPIGLDPKKYGITPHIPEVSFAHNDLDFTDETGVDHDKFSYGLSKSLYNYMLGIGFENALQDWFDFEIPQTSIDTDYILNLIEQENSASLRATSKLLWLGNSPRITRDRNKTIAHFVDKQASSSISLDTELFAWLLDQLEKIEPSNSPISLSKFQESYEKQFSDFQLFWKSKEMDIVRGFGLLVL
ncbi:MAG: hypothetical protein RLZZ337_996 [Bacteroidota bacterium]